MNATSPAVAPNPLNAVIRTLQQAHAVAMVAERAATHDMAEAHCLADVLVAVLLLIDTALDALDQLEARS